MANVFDAERMNFLEGEIKRLRQWVSDCQSGMYVNCVYCGHRYGPDTTTPVSHADLLKAHIEVCPEHPMSALKKSNDTLRRMLEGRVKYHQKVEEHLRKISAAALPVYDDAMSERIWVGMGDSLRRDDEGPLPTPAQVTATLAGVDEGLAYGDEPVPNHDLTPVRKPIPPTPPVYDPGGRHICTKENPWAPGKGKALHPDAVEVGFQEDGWPSGDLQKMRCPHCGETWKEELPQ